MCLRAIILGLLPSPQTHLKASYPLPPPAAPCHPGRVALENANYDDTLLLLTMAFR